MPVKRLRLVADVDSTVEMMRQVSFRAQWGGRGRRRALSGANRCTGMRRGCKKLHSRSGPNSAFAELRKCEMSREAAILLHPRAMCGGGAVAGMSGAKRCGWHVAIP